MEEIRILIVDDHLIVREGLTGMLAGQADFVVVGTAGSGAGRSEVQADQVEGHLRRPALDLQSGPKPAKPDRLYPAGVRERRVDGTDRRAVLATGRARVPGRGNSKL